MADNGIWMPLYWGDYLADTTHLTTEQHGAYLLLIAAYWRRGQPLPDDDSFLAACVKATPQKWRGGRLREVVGALFEISGGVWRHKRVDNEILKSTERLKSARANGRAGGVAKSKLVTITVTTTEEERKKETSLRDVMPKLKKKVQSQLPDGFPFQADFDWSNEYWLKRGRADLCSLAGDEAAQFRDHHLKKLTRSADWSASWRTWARNAIKFNNGGHNARRSTAHENFAAGALAAAMEDRS